MYENVRGAVLVQAKPSQDRSSTPDPELGWVPESTAQDPLTPHAAPVKAVWLQPVLTPSHAVPDCDTV